MWERTDFEGEPAGSSTDWQDPRLDVAPGTPKRARTNDHSWIRRGWADDEEVQEDLFGGTDMVAAVCEETPPHVDLDDLVIPGRAYYDQVTGERLDPEEVAAARKKEIDCMLEHEVY